MFEPKKSHFIGNCRQVLEICGIESQRYKKLSWPKPNKFNTIPKKKNEMSLNS